MEVAFWTCERVEVCPATLIPSEAALEGNGSSSWPRPRADLPVAHRGKFHCNVAITNGAKLTCDVIFLLCYVRTLLVSETISLEHLIILGFAPLRAPHRSP